MQFLVFLRISHTQIRYLPAWFTQLRQLKSIEATESPCYVKDLKRYKAPTHPHATLVDIVAARILEFIANGGDWTQTAELPDHLAQKIMHSNAPELREHLLLKNGFAGEKIFIFEKKALQLRSYPWTTLDRRDRKRHREY